MGHLLSRKCESMAPGALFVQINKSIHTQKAL